MTKSKLKPEGWTIKSPCGRIYYLSYAKVEKDYAKFLVSADKVTMKEAMAQARGQDLRYWFAEQFTYEDIAADGELVTEASTKQIKFALNFVRDQLGGHPYSNSKELK